MDAGEKEFVINKAATAGQGTLCTAVFGRGADFFCKDDRVQDGGGVHIIQVFLSLEKSEEVQIQGRTSRQGKKGSFQLVWIGSRSQR
jgi:preprotein translocase subunit SecA